MIECVKELEQVSGNYIEDCIVGGYKMYPIPSECNEPLEIADWIKHFFNLTEEDLK